MTPQRRSVSKSSQRRKSPSKNTTTVPTPTNPHSSSPRSRKPRTTWRDVIDDKESVARRLRRGSGGEGGREKVEYREEEGSEGDREEEEEEERMAVVKKMKKCQESEVETKGRSMDQQGMDKTKETEVVEKATKNVESKETTEIAMSPNDSKNDIDTTNKVKIENKPVVHLSRTRKARLEAMPGCFQVIVLGDAEAFVSVKLTPVEGRQRRSSSKPSYLPILSTRKDPILQPLAILRHRPSFPSSSASSSSSSIPTTCYRFPLPNPDDSSSISQTSIKIFDRKVKPPCREDLLKATKEEKEMIDEGGEGMRVGTWSLEADKDRCRWEWEISSNPSSS